MHWHIAIASDGVAKNGAAPTIIVIRFAYIVLEYNKIVTEPITPQKQINKQNSLWKQPIPVNCVIGD